MGKTYIEDFMDLNYQGIALVISDVDIELLKNKLKSDMINKTSWRVDYAQEVGDDIIFIENCDVDYYDAPAVPKLLEDGFEIHVLHYDEGGFYYGND